MSSTRFIYTSCLDITPDQARDARARAWRFVFDCYAKKKGGVPSTADDGKEIKDIPDKTILPQRQQP